MRVPFLDLKRQYNLMKENVESAVLACMESCMYIEGSNVKDFEKSMAEFLDVKHVITCGSGTSAICLALRAVGVQPGDEVITSAFSFFATAEAISSIGAIPVFVDICEDDYNIDVKKIEDKITSKTKAILPVHIFGQPANMDEINRVAEKNNLKVVEDACQAIGSEYKGGKTGTLGDVGCFSFYPTKNLGGFGDGGMITTNDDNIAMVCRALKSHGGGKLGFKASRILGICNDADMVMDIQQEEELYDPYKYYNYLIADNSRLDSMQAAVLNVKLPMLEKFNSSRAKIAEKYNHHLDAKSIKFPQYANDTHTCWHQYVVMVDEKEELINYLEKHEIGAASFYPVPLHLQVAFLDLGYKIGDCPVAENVCRKTVCLPIFPELTADEQDYVILTVNSFFK